MISIRRYDGLDTGSDSPSVTIAEIALTDQISRGILLQKEEELRQIEAKLLVVQELLQSLSCEQNHNDDGMSLHKMRLLHHHSTLSREEQV